MRTKRKVETIEAIIIIPTAHGHMCTKTSDLLPPLFAYSLVALTTAFLFGVLILENGSTDTPTRYMAKQN